MCLSEEKMSLNHLVSMSSKQCVAGLNEATTEDDSKSFIVLKLNNCKKKGKTKHILLIPVGEINFSIMTHHNSATLLCSGELIRVKGLARGLTDVIYLLRDWNLWTSNPKSTPVTSILSFFILSW